MNPGRRKPNHAMSPISNQVSIAHPYTTSKNMDTMVYAENNTYHIEFVIERYYDIKNQVK